MKVFVSWSGSISREVAVALRDWLPSVIQVVNPYVSSEDIDPGARWGADIATELDDTDFGILCVTRDNVNTPWLNFEAGALSKSVERSRVVPFLVDLGPSDIPRGPLAQFQAVRPTKEEVLRLIRGMNDFCNALPRERVDGTVDVWWPHLEMRLQEIQEQTNLVAETSPQRSTVDMLAELLELTRGLQREVQVRDLRPPTLPRSEGPRFEELMVLTLYGLAVPLGFMPKEMRDGPVDVLLRKDDQVIYVEIVGGRVNRKRVHEKVRQLHENSMFGPLLMITNRLVEPDIGEEIPNVRIVEWLGDRDNSFLRAAIRELGGVADES